MGKYSDLVRRIEPANGTVHTSPRPVDWLMELMPGQYAKFGDVIVGRVTITPAMAKVILERCNVDNRKFRISQTNKILESIRAGEWRFNGETVIFDERAYLTNGQHRLRSCELSGKSIETLVVVGVREGIQATIDITSTRTGADRLGQLGYKSCTTLQGALNYLWRLFNGMMPWKGSASNSHIEKMIESHSKIQHYIRIVDGFYHRRGASFSLWAAFLYVASVIDEAKAIDFVQTVITGRSPTETFSPASDLLYKRLDSNLGSKAKMPTSYIFALAIKSWNCFLYGKSIRSLRWSEEEEFPKFSWIAYVGNRMLDPVQLGAHEEHEGYETHEDNERLK